MLPPSPPVPGPAKALSYFLITLPVIKSISYITELTMNVIVVSVLELTNMLYLFILESEDKKITSIPSTLVTKLTLVYGLSILTLYIV